MSFYNLLYHIIFATKNRQKTIETAREKELYAILYSIMKKNGAYTHRIGGMPDHVHILVSIPPDISISKFIQNLKRESSLAASDSHLFDKWDGWQNGYGIFTCSRHDYNKIFNYIKNQKEHHANISFIEEYRQWLIENGISPDEPYFPK